MTHARLPEGLKLGPPPPPVLSLPLHGGPEPEGSGFILDKFLSFLPSSGSLKPGSLSTSPSPELEGQTHKYIPLYDPTEVLNSWNIPRCS